MECPERRQKKSSPWKQNFARDIVKVILCQISTLLLEKYDNDLKGYYDLIWSNRQDMGFWRPEHFWEIPNWIAIIKKNIPDADFVVIDDVDSFLSFLNETSYTHICFSVMDVNKEIIRNIIQRYHGNGRFVLGGYVDFSYFVGLPVRVYRTIPDFIGKEYVSGYDYSHFYGQKCIPRLTMSVGCKNTCAFCTEVGNFSEVNPEWIQDQADSFKGLSFRLVYLNDKTFGQARNHIMLPELYRQIKMYQQDFEGFVIQTTSTQWLNLSDQFVVDSHIRFVEIGVETFNDEILSVYHKPSRERVVIDATDKVRRLPVKMLPNIVVGFPEETKETYSRTLKYLRDNKDCMSF